MATGKARWAKLWPRNYGHQTLRYERLAARLFIMADALEEVGRVKAAKSMREAAYRFRVLALCQAATVQASMHWNIRVRANPSA
jgi:hypothetical protein